MIRFRKIVDQKSFGFAIVAGVTPERGRLLFAGPPGNPEIDLRAVRVSNDGEVKAYLDWLLSDEGQRIIMEKGYAPVRPLTSK